MNTTQVGNSKKKKIIIKNTFKKKIYKKLCFQSRAKAGSPLIIKIWEGRLLSAGNKCKQMAQKQN